jgi:hypothetical protein
MHSSSKIRSAVRKAATPLTAILLALGISASMATPASASNSYNGNTFMKGDGDFRDDWNDEGIVAEFGGYNRNSNVTCLWQKIVFWADSSIGSRDQIDGYFGHNTTIATHAWQSNYMWPSAVDGVAGKDTWAAAGTRLRDTDGDGTVDKYDGRYRDIAISRINGGLPLRRRRRQRPTGQLRQPNLHHHLGAWVGNEQAVEGCWSDLWRSGVCRRCRGGCGVWLLWRVMLPPGRSGSGGGQSGGSDLPEDLSQVVACGE